MSVAIVGKDLDFTIYDDAMVEPFLASIEGEERRGQRYVHVRPTVYTEHCTFVSQFKLNKCLKRRGEIFQIKLFENVVLHEIKLNMKLRVIAFMTHIISLKFKKRDLFCFL